MVAAGYDLRRAIERELHDGIQQRLIVLAVKLQLARGVAEGDPAALHSLLDELGQDLQEALDEVRRLAWRVYPSLLLDAGIAEALRAAASEAAVGVRIEGQAIDRYPPDVEATAYFSCLELFEAAARFADRGSGVTVRLREEPGAFTFEVSVDRTDPEQWKRADVSGVRERLGALGGTLTFRSEGARGAAHVGSIPLDPGQVSACER